MQESYILTYVLTGAASLFSMMLAIFAIWLAFQQRRESQANYEKTKDVLGEVRQMMQKTELLVSENFQNLLSSITEQQTRMLEAMKPKKTSDELLFELATSENPQKLDSVVNAIIRIQEAQTGTDGSAMLSSQDIHVNASNLIARTDTT
jgi:hypothetical protein